MRLTAARKQEEDEFRSFHMVLRLHNPETVRGVFVALFSKKGVFQKSVWCRFILWSFENQPVKNLKVLLSCDLGKDVEEFIIPFVRGVNKEETA